MRRLSLASVFTLVILMTGSADFLRVRETAASSSPPVSVEYSITVDGTARTYLLYVPASLPSGPAPLVVMMRESLEQEPALREQMRRFWAKVSRNVEEWGIDYARIRA